MPTPELITLSLITMNNASRNYFRASVGGSYAGRFFLAASAVSALMGAWSFVQSFQA